MLCEFVGDIMDPPHPSALTLHRCAALQPAKREVPFIKTQAAASSSHDGARPSLFKNRLFFLFPSGEVFELRRAESDTTRLSKRQFLSALIV